MLWARKAALRARGREIRHDRLDPAAAEWLTPRSGHRPARS